MPRRFVLLLLWFTGLAPAWAIDPGLTLGQLSHTAWGVEQGAPSSIFAMAQTRDGLLWLGAPSGLYSFDGMRFERFEGIGDERLRTTNIESLFATRDGALWVGLRYGGAARLQDGHLQMFGPEVGLPQGSSVTAFAEGPGGAVWVGTVAGLWRYDGRQWRGYGAADGVPQVWVKSMLFDRAGTLWLSQVDGLYALARGDKKFRAAQPDRPRGYLAEGADGSVWMSGSDVALQRMAPAVVSDAASAAASANSSANSAANSTASSSAISPVVASTLPTVQGPPSRLFLPAGSGPVLEDRDGVLWVSGDDGVRRIRDPNHLPTGVTTLPDDRVETITSTSMSGAKAWAMLEDREGNLWLGTSQGLDRWRAPKLTVLPRAPRQLGFTLVRMNDGDLLATDFDLPAMRLHGTGATLYKGVPALATAGFRDSAGTLWLGTDAGVYQLHGDAAVEQRLPPDIYGVGEKGGRRLHVQAFTEAADKSLWMSVSRRGVYRLADGQWTKRSGVAGVPAKSAVALHTDAAGTTWLAYGGGDVAAVARSGAVRVYTVADGLTGGTVLAMEDSGAGLWLGGETGLFHFDGARFRSVASADGKGFRGVSGIVQLADGELWLNGVDGLARVPGAAVDDWLRRPDVALSSERFDYRDGLVGEAVQSYPLPSLMQAGDGRIWVATQASLASIAPTAIRRNPVAPDVLIRGVLADGRRLAIVAAAAIEPLAAGLRTMRIDFTATSLGSPEQVRFRYRLEGLDTDWTEAANQRQVSYNRLPPGRYRFVVTAANEDGVWSPRQAAYAFDVAPRWFETWTFRGVCVLLLIGLGAGAQRWRQRHLAARADERASVRLGERQRIARELHDTLLQGLQGLVLQIQVGLLQLPAAGVPRKMLETALDQAESTIVEARQRVTLLRLAEQSDEPLHYCLERWGQELAATSSTAFTLTREGVERPLRPTVQTEAAMVGREALVNAFQHANAEHVDVRLSWSDAGFELQVRDDGRGLDPGVADGSIPARPGHWGMSGMRERARELGGVLRVVSSEGGTVIELSVPSAAAFMPA